MVGPYIGAQSIGGLLAALMDWFMFGSALRSSLILGAAHPGPGIAWWTALFTELVITAVLLNPARTLAPDIVSLRFPFWWVYIVGPVLGACFGATLWKFGIAKGRKDVVEAVPTQGG